LLAVILPLACLFTGHLHSQDAEEPQQPPPRQYKQGALIRFEGTITPLLEHYIYRKLDVARDRGADLIIIEIDSPGGFLDASLNLAERFLHLDWAHTVAYIPDEGLSGAAIAALGCDEIIMGPKAHLGDAGPIFQGEDALFRHAPEKIRSELALKVRDLAEQTGRPAALAEAMVDMDLVVYRVRNKNDERETFLSDHELEADPDPDQWDKLQPVHESREKHFLTVTGERAVELQLADGLASSRADIQQRYGLQNDLLILEPSAVDTTVFILNIPVITALLLIAGLVALYVEFSAPGLGIGGVVAAMCFLLFFWSKFLGGTAVWLEVLLFLAGVIFMLVEVFITPGFGVAGITGMLLMISGLLMAGQHFVLPTTTRELNTSLQGMVVIVGAGFAFLAAAFGISHYLGAIPVLSWMTLELPSASQDETSTDEEGKPRPALTKKFPVAVGDWGIADSPLRPAGKVVFGEEYVDVVTDGSFVDRGQQVRVIDISGNRVVVREVNGTA
jgi:membrane-bound serine protease (ClpP class)